MKKSYIHITVFSMDGMLNGEAHMFLKKIGNVLAVKWEKSIQWGYELDKG